MTVVEFLDHITPGLDSEIATTFHRQLVVNTRGLLRLSTYFLRLTLLATHYRLRSYYCCTGCSRSRATIYYLLLSTHYSLLTTNLLSYRVLKKQGMKFKMSTKVMGAALNPAGGATLTVQPVSSKYSLSK